MTSPRTRIKLYHLFTLLALASRPMGQCREASLEMMVAIPAAMFIALFGWGSDYFGWDDTTGRVQLAMFTTFVLGAICGYKSRS